MHQSKDYHACRKTNTLLSYGLLRRTEAVIQELSDLQSGIVLDIGTADGLLLYSLMEHHNDCTGIGIDTERCRLKYAKEIGLRVAQADGRQLPFPTYSIDVIILAAVLKHVKGLERLILECHRVLKPGSKMITIDPTPLGIYLGILLGYFSKQSIIQVMSLQATQQLLTKHDFKIICAKRFMLSPVPFTGCDTLERALKRAHLDQLFFNQIIVCETIRTTAPIAKDVISVGKQCMGSAHVVTPIFDLG